MSHTTKRKAAKKLARHKRYVRQHNLGRRTPSEERRKQEMRAIDMESQTHVFEELARRLYGAVDE